MSPDIGKFLKIRNEINWRLARLISSSDLDTEDLQLFCQQVTDYLLSGAYILAMPSIPFAEDFCRKYAKGEVDDQPFVQDLSKLTIILAERWNLEDQCIKKELATA